MPQPVNVRLLDGFKLLSSIELVQNHSCLQNLRALSDSEIVEGILQTFSSSVFLHCLSLLQQLDLCPSDGSRKEKNWLQPCLVEEYARKTVKSATLCAFKLMPTSANLSSSRFILTKGFCQQASDLMDTDTPRTRVTEDLVMEVQVDELKKNSEWDFSNYHSDALGYHLIISSATDPRLAYIPLGFMSPFCPYHLAQLITLGESRIATLAFASLKRVFNDKLLLSLRINSRCFQHQKEGTQSNLGGTLRNQALLCIEPSVTLTPSDDWAHSCLFYNLSYRRALVAFKRLHVAVSQSMETDFDSLFRDLAEFYSNPPAFLGDKRGCIRSLKMTHSEDIGYSYEWIRVLYQHDDPSPVISLDFLWASNVESCPIFIRLGDKAVLFARPATQATDDSPSAEAAIPEDGNQTQTGLKTSLVGLLRLGKDSKIDMPKEK